MCVGTSVTAAALITAGGTIAGKAIEAHAASSAADKQKAASDEALKYAKEQDAYKAATEANRYARMSSGVTPFVSAGGSAAARQAQLLGLPTPAAGPALEAPPTYPTPPPPGLVNPTGSTAGAIPRTPPQVPNPGQPYTGPAGAAAGGPGGAPGSPGGTTKMRSPDGKSTQDVPTEQVEHYRQLGATVVS